MTPSLPRYVTENEAATVLGVSRGTLSNWRSERRGPAYVRLGGGRVIRYKLSEIEAFAEAHRVTPVYTDDFPRKPRKRRVG
jgi:predicted DNA-binding transcriptional regulator AlpA